MNTNGVIIRFEDKGEYREVENLIRESFWNVYRPGCSEHYVIHVLRDDPAFVKELDFVMEKDGRLIGQNVFVRTVINADDGRDIDVLTMGPICIAPELKRKGYGKLLLDYSLEKAAEMGFGAVLFEGNIDFYGKSGFDYARTFGIRYHDLPEGADDSFFLCRELISGYLDGVSGEYATPQGYFVNEEEAEEFLLDCMAVVVDSVDEVWEYFEEEGLDMEGADKDEILEASEVFDVGDGRYLIVEA